MCVSRKLFQGSLTWQIPMEYSQNTCGQVLLIWGWSAPGPSQPQLMWGQHRPAPQECKQTNLGFNFCWGGLKPKLQNPKSKPPKCKIQNPKFKNPKSKLQEQNIKNPKTNSKIKSKFQTPKSKKSIVQVIISVHIHNYSNGSCQWCISALVYTS